MFFSIVALVTIIEYWNDPNLLKSVISLMVFALIEVANEVLAWEFLFRPELHKDDPRSHDETV